VASPTTPPTVGARIASIAVSIAAAFVILGVSIVPFLTPQWIHGEQDRAGADAYFSGDPTLPNLYSDAIVHDLVFGGAFDVGAARLNPLLDPKEQAHMRDVRGAFQGLALLISASAIWLVATRRRSRASAEARASWWRAVSHGGALLAVFMIAVGVLALVAFDAMFEVFHELLFPPGSFSFDPATERLVQLYPDQFWSDTTLALGVVAVVLSVGVAWFGARRARTVSVAPPAQASASLTPRSAR
jgi:integral membrane protein (TIGR01906 family)